MGVFKIECWFDTHMTNTNLDQPHVATGYCARQHRLIPFPAGSRPKDLLGFV